MSDDLDLTVDEAVDAVAGIYWQDIIQGVADRDIDKVYDAAIFLKATQSTREKMKAMFEQ
jgi:hypothetical protein